MTPVIKAHACISQPKNAIQSKHIPVAREELEEREVSWILDIGHWNLQCTISIIQLTSRSKELDQNIFPILILFEIWEQAVGVCMFYNNFIKPVLKSWNFLRVFLWNIAMYGGRNSATD